MVAVRMYIITQNYLLPVLRVMKETSALSLRSRISLDQWLTNNKALLSKRFTSNRVNFSESNAKIKRARSN